MLNPKTGKPWKVYVGTPTTGKVADFQSFLLRELEDRYGDEVELVYPKQLCQRIFHDAARVGIVEDFLTTDADILWFLDSDVVPPKHVLDLVTMHGDEWQVAGAPYPVFMAQPGESQRQIVFTVYKRIADGPDGKPRVAPCAVPNEGTEFIDGIATGCLMIKREVFDKLEKPYFEFKYDPITRQPSEGEDIGFILKMSRLGIKFFVDYSMLCKHYKDHIDLLEMNNYCLDFAHKSIENFNNQIAAQMQELDVKFREIMAENAALKQEIARSRSSLVGMNGKPLIFK